MLKRLSMRLVVFALVFPAVAFAQSALENPAPGSAQSGIGIVSGWKCSAGTITVTFDDGVPFQAAYGTAREDTRSVCGDADNGFGLLFNWNILGTGSHSVKVFDGGVQFGGAIVTVTTFGTEFLTGQSGGDIFSFAGRQVTVQWSERAQNFVITGVGPPGGQTNTFSGTWRISAQFVSEDCNLLSGPEDLPLSVGGMLIVTQNGTSLTVTQGAITLTGNVEADGDFSIVTPPEVRTHPNGCTQTTIGGTAGNFVDGDAIFAAALSFSGSCSVLANNCTVLYSGTIDRVSALSDESETWGAVELLGGIIGATRRAMRE
jgi:hypothetical protein